eukprot:scaffold122946_cov46-Prasinocladus_malaysianus.AAC.1
MHAADEGDDDQPDPLQDTKPLSTANHCVARTVSSISCSGHLFVGTRRFDQRRARPHCIIICRKVPYYYGLWFNFSGNIPSRAAARRTLPDRPRSFQAYYQSRLTGQFTVSPA